MKSSQAITYQYGVPWDGQHGISQGYSINGTIYISGQFSHDMQGNFIGEGCIEAQTRQTLENLDRVLAGFGVTKNNLAYVEVYLTHAKEDFEPCVRLFAEYMGEHRPAGSCVGMDHLASDGQLIEISAIAHAD